MINKEVRDIAREAISNIFTNILKKYTNFTIQVIESIPSGDIKIYISDAQVWDVFRKSSKFSAFKKEMKTKYDNTVTSYSVLSYGLDNEEIIYQLEREKAPNKPESFKQIEAKKEQKERNRKEKALRDKALKNYGLKIGDTVEFLHYENEYDYTEARQDEITGFTDTYSENMIGVKFKGTYLHKPANEVRIFDPHNFELRHKAYMENNENVVKVGISIALHDTEDGLYNKFNTVQKVVHQLDKEDEIYILSHGELVHITNDKYHVSG